MIVLPDCLGEQRNSMVRTREPDDDGSMPKTGSFEMMQTTMSTVGAPHRTALVVSRAHAERGMMRLDGRPTARRPLDRRGWR